jgi:hypothetical protein
MDDLERGDRHAHNVRHGHHANRRAGSGLRAWGALAIIIIIIVIALALVYLFGGRAIAVNAPYIGRVTGHGALYSIEGGDYFISAAGNYVGGDAYIHMTQLPFFLNSMLNITLVPNTLIKVNYAGSFASVGFKLIMANRTGETVEIDPLPPSLQVTPDSQDIRYVNYSLLGSIAAPSSSGSPSGQVGSAPGTGSATSSSTSTVGTTTSVGAGNLTLQRIDSVLANDQFYPLMLDFNSLYSNSTGCTPSLYNATYIKHYSHAPSGTESYYNVSSVTPYALLERISGSGSSYTVEFVAMAKGAQFNNTAAMSIVVDTSTGAIKSDTTEGIFAGETYSGLQGSYTQSASVGNACAALIG